MNHEAYKELLELEALDALEEAESHALEEHLAGCPECRAELEELRETAAALSYLTEPLMPSQVLRERILQLSQTPRLPSPSEDVSAQENSFVAATLNNENAGGGERSSSPTVATSNLIRFPTVPGSKWSKGSLLTLIAASIVCAILLSLLIVLWRRNQAMGEDLSRLSRQNTELQDQVNRLSQNNNELTVQVAQLTNYSGNERREKNQPANRQSPSEVENVIVERHQNQNLPTPAPNQNIIVPTPPAETSTQVVTLAGTNLAPQARARLAFDDVKGALTLNVSDLPQAPTGKAYQLWFIVKGKPVPGGVFSTGPTGQGMMHGPIPVEARNASAFAVTLENSTGANKPTGAKYLLGSI